MRLAAQVLVDDVEIDVVAVSYEAQAGTRATIRLLPVKWDESITTASLLTVKLGRFTSAGARLWTLADDARVVGIAPVHAFGGSSLEIEVDTSDGRFAWAPATTETWGSTPLSALLRYVFVDQLGFAAVVTNVPDYAVREARFEPTATWVESLSHLFGFFEPLVFLDHHADVVAVLDARRPIPAGLPARTADLSTIRRLQRSVRVGEIVNSVKMTWSSTGLGTGAVPSYTEREIEDPADETPDGFAKSRTWRRVREYEDPEDPSKVSRTVVVGTRTRDYGDDGAPINEVETTITYRDDASLRDVEHQVVSYTLVTVPSGSEDYLKCRVERLHRNWKEEDDGAWRVVSEYGSVEGLVLDNLNLPLDEASRSGVVLEDAGQPVSWAAIERSHTYFSPLGEGRLEKVTTIWDLLHNGRRVQRAEVATSSSTVRPQASTSEKIIEDAASITTYGRRKQRTLDVTPYGPVLGEEIIRAHVLGRRGGESAAMEIELLGFDPSVMPGEIWRVTTREGATRVGIATGLRVVLDRRNEVPGGITVSLVEVSEV